MADNTWGVLVVFKPRHGQQSNPVIITLSTRPVSSISSQPSSSASHPQTYSRSPCGRLAYPRSSNTPGPSSHNGTTRLHLLGTRGCGTTVPYKTNKNKIICVIPVFVTLLLACREVDSSMRQWCVPCWGFGPIFPNPSFSLNL